MKKIHFSGMICLLVWLALPFAGKAQTQAPAGNGSLRVISYNIWNGFEKDTTRRTRFIEWVKKQQPAILALTELVGFTEKDLAELAASYGHPYAAIVKEEGYPVGVTSTHPITVVSKQVEGYWHGLLHVRTWGLDVLVTHLSPFEWKFRLKEAQAITAYIGSHQLDSCLIMGDFNAYSPFDADVVETHATLIGNMRNWDANQKVYRNMRDGRFDYSVLSEFLSTGLADVCRMYVPADQRTSFPSAFLYGWKWGDPRLKQLGERLDYILVSPALLPACTNAYIFNGEENEGISDHYPVGVDLAFPAR